MSEQRLTMKVIQAGDANTEGLASGLPLLWAALALVVLFHGALLFNQSFVRSYDALIHIFFGSHYARSWFDPWEPRWYTGFSTVSYPPLAHQLIALFSKIVDLKSAFVLVQLFALLNLTVGVFRFSSLVVSYRAAGYASLLLVVSSAIVETVHVFGQLPTTLALSFLLNAIPFVLQYLRLGRRMHLFQALAWMCATTAGHHVSTVFGSVFFTAPILVIGLLEGFRIPRPNEPVGQRLTQKISRRLYRLAPGLYRNAVFTGWTIVSLIVVVFPYWYWSKTDPILQVSIPHASRDNFLVNIPAGLMFFFIPWLSTCWFLPYAFYKGFTSWRWPLAASLAMLFLLGTGGTTPLPRMLLRGAFDILTLDRFTFWATILVLPFAGMCIESAVFGRMKLWLDANVGRRVRLAAIAVLLLCFLVMAVGVSSLTRYRKFQPEPIDVQPIVQFIEKDQHWRYRYLTLGFGDQMAWLSANTRALTPDGNYHSARRLIELTTTPVERLDGAKYTGVSGIGSLEQFVTVPEKYNLKFIFSNDTFYDPLLYFSGWHRLQRLENGIIAWERDDVPPLPERLPRKTLPIYQRIMWGILPLLSLLLAFTTLFLPVQQSRIIHIQCKGLGRRVLRLLRQNSTVEELGETLYRGEWQPWRLFFARLRSILKFTRLPVWIRLVRLACILLVAALFGFRLSKVFVKSQTPESVVLEYWNDVDFKKFTNAYAHIAPQGGLNAERFVLDLSVQGGLRSGYAKLDAIRPVLMAHEGNLQHPSLGDRALVRADLSWVTSLERFEESITSQLVFTKRGWRILFWPLVKPRPKDRFAAEPKIDYYRAPSRLTTAVTSPNDVLDRPVLSVLDSRLVSSEVEIDDPELPVHRHAKMVVTMYSIVGEIQNTDARPADITLTGVLRSETGEELARNNAGTLMVHKLLPGERTPFRVDFIGSDAPNAPDKIDRFEIFAKAVVTSHDLSKELVVWAHPVNQLLQLSVANVGTRESSVARALIGLFDQKGIAWVDNTYLMESIPPRENKNTTVTIQRPSNYQVIKIGVQKDSKFLKRTTAPFYAQGFTSYLIELQSFEANP